MRYLQSKKESLDCREFHSLFLSVTCHEGLNRLSDFRENRYRHLLQKKKSSSQHEFHEIGSLKDLLSLQVAMHFYL